MQSLCVLSLLLAFGAPALAENAKTNPMAKVIQLMDELAAKITKEGEAEAKAYNDFFAWCDDASRTKGFEIKEATAAKEKLEAAIGEAASEAEGAAQKIEELVASIAADEEDLKKATGIREKEAADFAASEKELIDTVDTLERAIGIIDKAMSKSGAAFAQVDVSSISNLLKTLGAVVDAASFTNADKQKLLALVQAKNGDDSEEMNAPAAAVYESKSGGILDILEEMKEKAETQLDELRKEETNAQHNYAMVKQSLDAEIKTDTADMEEAKVTKASATEAKATAESELTETNKDLADAQNALETCHASCMETAADHEATVKARAEELAVIAKAKAILNESSGGAVGQVYLQVAARSQMRTRADLKNAEVVSSVKNLAKEFHSPALAQLASRIGALIKFGTSAGEDPFGKIKGLITDMIAKLEKEAAESANEKAYCDEQMSKTAEKKGELAHEQEKLASKIDQATAGSASLKEEVKELQAELATLAKEQGEMDATRSEQHAAYSTAKADLESGLEGVRAAMGMLRDYYGGAAAGGNTDAANGIISILEVCESDFAKALAVEETEEADAASEYDTVTQKNTVTKTLKDQDVKYKTQEFTGLDKTIAELSADKETTDSEHAAILEYDAKIKDRCVAKPESYEDRKARRESEIAGLKSALATLEDEAALVQQRKRGSRGHFLGF